MFLELTPEFFLSRVDHYWSNLRALHKVLQKLLRYTLTHGHTRTYVSLFRI